MKRGYRAALLLAALICIMCAAPALGDEYLDDSYTPIGMITVSGTGEYGDLRIDVMEYERGGERYYALCDTARGICAYKGVNELKHDITGFYDELIEGEKAVWRTAEECPYTVEAYALGSVQRVYDFYYNNFGWKSFDGRGDKPTRIITNLDRFSRGEDETWWIVPYVPYVYKGKTASKIIDDIGYIYIGQALANTNMYDLFNAEMMCHEYTHNVLGAHGIDYDGERIQAAAVCEGYCDVMAVCCAGVDWKFSDLRNLGDDSGITHMEDYKDNRTESHEGATILGYAAYLMCEAPAKSTDIIPILDGEPLEGEPLLKLDAARLFFTSMKRLGKAPTFEDAGKALMAAAQELRQTIDLAGDYLLTDEQVIRVAYALRAVGIDVDIPDMSEPDITPVTDLDQPQLAPTQPADSNDDGAGNTEQPADSEHNTNKTDPPATGRFVYAGSPDDMNGVVLFDAHGIKVTILQGPVCQFYTDGIFMYINALVENDSGRTIHALPENCSINGEEVKGFGIGFVESGTSKSDDLLLRAMTNEDLISDIAQVYEIGFSIVITDEEFNPLYRGDVVGFTR